MRTHVVLTAVLIVGLSPALGAREGDKTIRRERAEALPAAPGASDAPKLVIDPRGFTGPVGGLAFSPDGRWLAAAGDDKTVRIWEIATERLVATLRGQAGAGSLGACTAVAFSPDGRSLVVGVEDSTPEGTIRIYDTSDWERIAQLLPGHARGGTARVEFSGDGTYLVSAGADKEVVIWDWATRSPIGHGTFRGRLSYLGFPWPCPVVVAFDEFNFYAWSARDGRDLFQMPPEAADSLVQGPGAPRDFEAFVAEMNALGRALARTDWPYGGHPGARRLLPERGQFLVAGRSLVDGRDRYWIGLWSAGEGLVAPLYEQHRYLVSALALGPDRNLMASADLQGDIHLWDLRSGQRRGRFAGAGHPLYNVGFDASGRRLAFGFTTYGADQWDYNHYAPLERTFDLENRRISRDVGGPHQTIQLEKGRRALRLSRDPATGIFALLCLREGQIESRYTFPPRSQPMCDTFLRSTRLGVDDPVVVGLHNASLTCRDPQTMLSRRIFLGHQGAVTSLSESPDGRFLASSSADRTLRIWGLDHVEPMADVDFDVHIDRAVNYVVPGGPAARAGVRVGDRFLKMDGMDAAELPDLFLSHQWRWHVGDRVTLDMERDGQPYRVEVALGPGRDYAEPLLSLYAPSGEEWVLWTPQGYYDCSPGGMPASSWVFGIMRA